jgi:predicted acetyltransferase
VADQFVTRAVTADEWPAFFAMLSDAFGEDNNDDDLALETLTAEADRSLAVFDGSAIVGTAGAFTFDLTVPGSHAAAAGVTYVGVHPTHRRRGILTSLMRRQLDDIRERGEPVAILWASEAAIYGRFGYGLASQRLDVDLDRVDASLRPDLPDTDGVEVRLVPPGEVTSDIERIEAAVAPTRAGMFVRDKRWIELLVADPESRRRGMSRRQCLLASRDGEAVGYALYRTKADVVRPYGLPNGDVHLIGLAATESAVTVALLRTLLSIDLMRRVRCWNLPVDSELPHLLRDPRHVRTTLLDALFLRIVDIGPALSARRYVAPVDVVLEVADAFCPWNDGRWHLVGDRDGARCERTSEPARVRLSTEALGAAYLGGTRLTTLAAAGRVAAEDEKTLAAVSVAFQGDNAPWCPTVF